MSTPAQPPIPEPIRQYLESNPAFALSDDLNNQCVRTSIESFYYAVSLIYESLLPGQVIWSTDNLTLSPNFAKYWVEEGLQYLRINHEATGRGIHIHRIFIVSRDEYMKFGAELRQLGLLHSMTGVQTYVALYDRLPQQCRYDFAMWGDIYVDEVIYDYKQIIVDNYIRWSSHARNQFSQKLALIRSLIETSWNAPLARKDDFANVLQYAAEIRDTIAILPRRTRPRPRSPKVETIHSSTEIKVLLLSVNPIDSAPLRTDEEFREIDKALRQSTFRTRIHLEQHSAVRVSDLQGYLLRHTPHIVHFSGHGSHANELVLEDADGTSQSVSIRSLSQLFSVLKDNVRCVVLNACFSEQQALAIANHIDCVIGMSSAIGDKAAVKFATAFYEALGYGKSIKVAFDLGCVLIDLESLGEHQTPRLFALRQKAEDIVLVSE